MQHSREGSADSAAAGALCPGGLAPPRGAAGALQIAHGRSRSSPAMLPNTLTALNPGPGPNPGQIHYKQQSLGDFTEDGLGPLPHGWEMAKTADGQRYYLK